MLAEVALVFGLIFSATLRSNAQETVYQVRVAFMLEKNSAVPLQAPPSH